jgi:hypothetical protein
LEAEAVTEKDVKELAAKYGLSDKWNTFKVRFLDED